MKFNTIIHKPPTLLILLEVYNLTEGIAIGMAQ